MNLPGMYHKIVETFFNPKIVYDVLIALRIKKSRTELFGSVHFVWSFVSMIMDNPKLSLLSYGRKEKSVEWMQGPTTSNFLCTIKI